LNSRARRLWIACSIAVGLVLVRAFVFFWYEQNFDSDQAIIGLMAKHLSEFRTFPLFFYGQNYMLGVEAWIAVPFFWIGGPTVSMLRLPLVLINLTVVVLLMRMLTAGGVSPWYSFVAVLPLAACGPATSGQLLTALGASVEPLLYVIVLWLLRRRPIAFGAFLCVASLHREFTVFAVPPIILLDWWRARAFRWRSLAMSVAAFAAAWLAVDAIKRIESHASISQEAEQVGRLLSFHPDVYFARLRLLLTQGVPDLFGARPLPLIASGIWGETVVGWRVAGAALACALLVAAGRLVWLALRRRLHVAPFAIFLGIVGVEALVAYPLHGGTAIEPRTDLNYVLLALLLPVGVLGMYLQSEFRASWRRSVAVLVSAWALLMTVDNVRVTHEYLVEPPTSLHRLLADYLMTHRIKYAWAGYWDSYRVTFLSRERVIVASTETVRIPSYQTRVEQNQGNAARLQRVPCDEGTHVAEWCVIDPFHR